MVGKVGADPTTPEGNGFTDRRVCRFSVLSYKVGIVSCIIRYYFNPCGTGSHLYPANTNTLRSRTLSSRSYTTLVGLGFSPSPCFPLCAFIIARIRLFVKHFFLPSLIFFREDTWREPRGSFSYRMGHNLNPSLRNWQGVFFRVSFP